MLVDEEPEEYRLACRARSGEREALAALVERLRGPLFALAYRDLRHYEDAQDVVAEALLHVCRHIGDLRQPERIRAWMQQIVRNEVRRCRRCPQGRALPAEMDLAAGDRPPERAPAEPSLLRLDILRTLRELPRDQSRSVALYHLAGCSTKDIARQLGRPEGTIRRWLCEGRRQLEFRLDGYGVRRQTMTAGIVRGNLEPSLVRALAERLRRAGWEEAVMLDGTPALKWQRTGEIVEWHLPEPWRDVRLFVVPEWVGGRSTLELLPLLKLPVEGGANRICVLASPPVADSTLFAYWDAGVDAFFTLPADESFERSLGRLRQSIDDC